MCGFDGRHNMGLAWHLYLSIYMWELHDFVELYVKICIVIVRTDEFSAFVETYSLTYCCHGRMVACRLAVAGCIHPVNADRSLKEYRTLECNDRQRVIKGGA